MQMRLIFTLLFLTCCYSHASKIPRNDIYFAILETSGVLEADDPTRPYNKLMSRLIETAPFTIKTKYLSYEKAMVGLESQRVDCVFPVVRGKQRAHFETVYGESVNQIAVFLFSLEGKFKSFQEVQKQTVLYYRGYDFGNWELKDKHLVHLFAVENKRNVVKLLEKKRAIAYIDYLPDLKQSMSLADFSKLSYDPSYPLKHFEDTIECYQSEKNLEFINWFNDEIREMKATGELKTVLGNYYNF